MALLCEKLAWHMSRCSETTSKAGINSLDSDESLLLKGTTELNGEISELTSNLEFRRAEEKALTAVYALSQDIGRIFCCRDSAWTSAFSAIFQFISWCFGLMLVIFRFSHGFPDLNPT
jgi:hypothetical protein